MNSFDNDEIGAYGELSKDQIERIQELLNRNGANIPKSGILDEMTTLEIKRFQESHRNANGDRLIPTGNPDKETIDTLNKLRKWTICSISSLVALLIAILLLFVWNNLYWATEGQEIWKYIINSVLVVLGAVLLGIKKFSLSLPAGPLHRVGRVWRRFQISTVGLVVSILLMGASASILFLLPKQAPVLAPPTHKTIVHIGVVKNGDVPYTDIALGFRERVDKLLKWSAYTANFEEVTGFGETADWEKNEEVFNKLLARFPNNRPDYLVTLGTQVSMFAAKKYKDVVPIIFIGVTDPVASGIVEQYDADPQRGNIAGVTYGIRVRDRLQFMSTAFPRKHFGFIYNDTYSQDIVMKKLVTQLASQVDPPIRVVPIECRTPRLSPDQEEQADVFFGWQYVTQHIREFIAHSKKPFIGATVTDLKRGAVAIIGNDDKRLGELAGQEILFRNLVKGVALSDLAIIRPDTAITGVNLQQARASNVTINEDAIKKSQIVIP